MLSANADSVAVHAQDVVHRYGGVLALNGVSLTIPRGSFTAILGPNGAGKSTLGLILGGILKPTRGEISYPGIDPRRTRRAAGLVRHGVCFVPEGRRLFGQLTVSENLLLGGYGAGCGRAEIKRRMAEVLTLMPKRVQANLGRHVATFSGGERQMLALGRALMAEPSVIFIDEPSMGLAPILTDQVYEVLAGLQQRGVTVIVIEQIANHALEHANWVYLLERGQISYQGSASDDNIAQALRSGYVGGSAPQAHLTARSSRPPVRAALVPVSPNGAAWAAPKPVER